MSFRNKVKSVPSIRHCFRKGLRALKRGDRKYIKVKSKGALEGSVYLDGCLQKQGPCDSRWDYMIGYRGRVFFVEIHPAISSEVKAVLGKLRWLKEWKKGTPFERENRFIWVATKGVHISPRSSWYRQAVKEGLVIKSVAQLDSFP